MKIKRLFIAVMVFSLFLITSCSTEVDKNGVGNENEEFPPSMTGNILVNGKEYHMEEGGYQWERKQGTGTQVVMTDHASPNQMAETIKAISLIPNEKIKIKIEDDPEITVYLWNESGREKEVNIDDNQITVHSDKGKYIYEVEAKWKNGTVSYTFVIEI